MPQGFLETSPEEIHRLSDLQAVVLLHKLLLAEARQCGLNIRAISVPLNIYAPDGGIDGCITGEDDRIEQSPLLLSGPVVYQVKSAAVQFSPATLRTVLFDKTGQSTFALKPKVREIAEQNGTYVLFLTGQTTPGRPDNEQKVLDQIKTELPATTMKVRIIQTENIIAALAPHLAIRLFLKGMSQFTGMTHDNWKLLGGMNLPYQGTEDRNQIIANIKELALSNDSQDRNIRVTGFPGNGKTRSVLEALGTEELAPSVIYFDSPSKALDDGLLNSIVHVHHSTGIFVIDECDRNSLTQATEIIQNANPGVKLVTIYNEPGSGPSAIRNVDLNEDHKLDDDAVKNIIVDYGIPSDVAERWAGWCDGSPRVAHVLGECLNSGEVDLNQNPTHDIVMQYFVANRGDLTSADYDNRKRVLCWLSLFKRFGWHGDFEAERQFILHKIMNDTGLNEAAILRIVQDLRDRKILQGDKTLYISPRLLHIRAWSWWWDEHHADFDYEVFQTVGSGEAVVTIPDQLKHWFNSMFEYAQDSQAAASILNRLLGHEGTLRSNAALMEAIGNNFFLALTKASPVMALARLSKLLDSLSDDELRVLPGRSTILRSLEVMVVEQSMFQESAALMQRLALTETDFRYSNNSVGEFAGLFSNGYGQVAPTQAPPSERFPLLANTLNAHGDAGTELGIKCLDAALEADSFVRIAGPEERGLKADIKLWKPATNQEWLEAYEAPWRLLVDSIPTMKPELQEKAIEVVNNRLRGLFKFQPLIDMILSDYDQLVLSEFISKEKALSTLGLIVKYQAEGLPEPIVDKLKALIEKYEGNTLADQLERVVAMDIMDDWYGEDLEKSHKKLGVLVAEFLANPELLMTYKWLFTDKAKGGYRFALELGRADASHSLLPAIINCQLVSFADTGDNTSVFFLSGYIMSLFETDQDLWVKTITGLNTRKEFEPYTQEIVWRTGLNDEIGKLILTNLESGKGAPENLGMFRLGGSVKALSPKVFNCWIEYLLTHRFPGSCAVALDLFMTYYVFNEKKKLPEDLAIRILIEEGFVKKPDRRTTSLEWEWAQVATRTLEQHPKHAEQLLQFMVEHSGEDNTIFESYHREPTSVLNHVADLIPDKTWSIVASKLLTTKSYKSAYYLEHWLGGSAGDLVTEASGIDRFSKDMVFNWIAEDPAVRSILVARLIPHEFEVSAGGDSWLTLLLEQYGDSADLRNSITANFWSEGYSGPTSKHYAARLEQLRYYKSQHLASKNIRIWTSEYIDSLEKTVDRAKADEERSDFA